MKSSPEPRKLSRILLIVSLGLNILLIGAIVGTAAKFRSAPPRGFDFQMGPLGQILPRKDRAAIGRDLRRTLREEDFGREDRAAVATAVIDMLEAETFDADAMTALIRTQQVRQDRVRETALDAFVSHISQMSLAERQAIAATLKDRMTRGRDRR